MKILLKQEGNDLPIATMVVGEVFTPNKPLETLKCYGTSQLEHPGECVFLSGFIKAKKTGWEQGKRGGKHFAAMPLTCHGVVGVYSISWQLRSLAR